MSTVTKFEAKIKAEEGLKVSSTVRSHTLKIDEPKKLGGTDQGPNPVELVIAALGACQQIILKFYGQKLGIKIESIEHRLKET